MNRWRCLSWLLVCAGGCVLGCDGSSSSSSKSAEPTSSSKADPTKPVVEKVSAEADPTRQSAPGLAEPKDEKPAAPALVEEEPPGPWSAPHVIDASKRLDLITLPWPEGVDAINICETMLTYQGPGDLEKARSHYHSQFTKAGWKDISPATSGVGSRTYGKEGWRLYFMTSAGGSEPTDIMIQIMHQGNMDVRKLPRPPQAEESYEDRTNTSFFTSATVKEVEPFYDAELRKLGWRLQQRNAYKESVTLDWIQKGMVLSVSMGPSPAKPGKLYVQCTARMVREEVPLPEDAVITEYRDYPMVEVDLTTSKSVPESAEWGVSQMKEIGWEPRPDQKISDEAAQLFFKRGQRSAAIFITKDKEGGSKIHIGTGFKPTKEMLQLAEREEKREKERDEKRKADEKEAEKVAISTKDFPVPEDATEVDRSEFSKSVAFQWKTEVAKALAFYKDRMPADWKEVEAERQERKDFGQMEFRKEKGVIRIRVIGTEDKETFRLYIDGTGLKPFTKS